MKKTLRLFNIFLCVMFMQSLTACSTDKNIGTNKTSLDKDNTKKIESPKEQSKFSSLIINHKCIGCGRCSMTDPEHFTQYKGANKAIVKSQTNLNSKKITQAIQICPTKSIELL